MGLTCIWGLERGHRGCLGLQSPVRREVGRGAAPDGDRHPRVAAGAGDTQRNERLPGASGGVGMQSPEILRTCRKIKQKGEEKKKREMERGWG